MNRSKMSNSTEELKGDGHTYDQNKSAFGFNLDQQTLNNPNSNEGDETAFSKWSK